MPRLLIRINKLNGKLVIHMRINNIYSCDVMLLLTQLLIINKKNNRNTQRQRKIFWKGKWLKGLLDYIWMYEIGIKH